MSDNYDDSKLGDPFNSSKHLLDNVSFMTTLSPMPSQNTSLKPDVSTQGSQDVKFFDRIRSNLHSRITEEHEKSNISTLTALEDHLHDYLKETGSTATSSMPATTGIGTGGVMYGFDLSPVHSHEKKFAANVSNTLQENETVEISTRESFKKHFESGAALNFMQAKVASQKQLRSEKSKINEDTETVMSQVFSSQDVTSSVNEIGNKTNETEHVTSMIVEGKSKKQVGKKPSVASTKKPRSGTSRLQQGNVANYTDHSRFPRTNHKQTVKSASATSVKFTPTKLSKASPVIMTPKSPKTRKTTVKVSPKIKSTSKGQISKRQTSTKNNIKETRSDTSVSKLICDSTALSDANLSFTDIPATSSVSRSPNYMKIPLKESAANTSSLDEIDHTRLHMEGKLDSVTSERDKQILQNKMLVQDIDNLKKDNFVLKSKITQLMTNQQSKKIESTDANKENSSKDEIVRLKEEILEQDQLITGYQHENEKIYAELKEVKRTNKDVENAMFNENSKLKSEIEDLKEALERHARLADEKEKVGSSPNFPDIRSNDDDSTLKKRILSLEHQIRMEEGMRLKAESMGKRLAKDRDELEKQLRINECKSEEICQNLKTEHRIELGKVKSELADARRSLASKAEKISNANHSIIPPPESVLVHFQSRVKKLEADLENRDEIANKAVQQVRDDYNNVRMKYEKHIESLEKQIESFRESRGKVTRDKNTMNMKELQKQLSDSISKLREEKEAREIERNVLMDNIQKLKQKTSTPVKNKVVSSSEFIELKNACEAKNREIERLTSLLHKTFDNGRLGFHKNEKDVKFKKSSYNPDVFEADGYAGLLQQNSELKAHLEKQSLELKHSKVSNEALLCRLEQVTKTMQTQHEKEISQRQNPSSSQNAEKTVLMEQKINQSQNELDKCHKKILMLESQVKESSVSRVREQALQVQLQQLLTKLHESNSLTSSASARKIIALENKLSVAGEELRIKKEMLKETLISNSSSFAQNEISKLQEQLNTKNKELTRFRLELDSILLVLREIQSQGVKIPLPQYLQSII
ncbi:centrosomal protein of 162 kDa-like [Styela clava]